jgi:serine/threonine protein kinase
MLIDEHRKQRSLHVNLSVRLFVCPSSACMHQNVRCQLLLIVRSADECPESLSVRPSVCRSRGARIALDIATGIHFLHSQRIVHMDIKSPNVLLSRHGVAKLADVGLAKFHQETYIMTDASQIGGYCISCAGSRCPTGTAGRLSVHPIGNQDDRTSVCLFSCPNWTSLWFEDKDAVGFHTSWPQRQRRVIHVDRQTVQG